MKNMHLLTAVIGASMLVSMPVIAEDLFYELLEPDVIMDSPIASIRGQSAYVGTSLSDTRVRHHIVAPNSAFPNTDIDETGYVVGAAGPEKGNGDDYGSVLYDVGTLR